MKIFSVNICLIFLLGSTSLFALDEFETDIFKVDDGFLKIYFIGHGTLMFDYNGRIIHIDPVGREADYSQMPKADLILITHEHPDHLDADALGMIKKAGTDIILNESSAGKIKEGIVMKNGEQRTVRGLKIEAVPAYNTTEGRDRFHPKGRDNGYVVTFDDKRVYIAGDTENHPEMKRLKDIDIAFLPMNQPYTMLPEQVAEAAKAFRPKVLYPYHYGDTDVSELVALLKDVKNMEVRIRKLR